MLVCGWAFSYQVSLPCNQLLVWIQETFLFLKLDLKLYFLIKLIFRLTSVETVLSYPALGSVHWGGCSIMLWAFLLHFCLFIPPCVWGFLCHFSSLFHSLRFVLVSLSCPVFLFSFPSPSYWSLPEPGSAGGRPRSSLLSSSRVCSFAYCLFVVFFPQIWFSPYPNTFRQLLLLIGAKKKLKLKF